MSLFFRHIPTVEANFSVQSTVDIAAQDTLLVSQEIWGALCLSSKSHSILSIKSKRQYPTRSPSVKSLTCWAIYDSTVPEIAIPPAWLINYPTIFQPLQLALDGSFKPVVLSTIEGIVLTEVVLDAKHESAYSVASTHGAAFENWFFESHVIIRDGEDISVPTSIFSTCDTSVLSHLPLSPFAYTVSLTLPLKQGIAQRGSTRFVLTQSYVGSREVSHTSNPAGNETFEINESFLISAVLSSPGPQLNEGGVVFSAKALPSPIDPDLDQVTVYIYASDLRPLGVLNGDWVLASALNSSTSRLVRVGVLDVASADSSRWSAMLSPVLLHNLCLRGQQIVLRVSPYGSRDPGVPTARSIKLTRVPSPFSICRRYETLLTDVLHEYFGSSKRFIKCGDIIPLRIDVDRSVDPRHVLREGDFTGGAMHSCADVPVYFVVRDVDCESTTVRAHRQPLSRDHLGCFVDSKVTRIVQVGVEHARVPDIYGYYELGHARMTFPGVFGISRQVSQLSSSMSLDDVASFGVRSKVCISGPRGSGKFSTAMYIARHLRIHHVEINCFNILSDTTAKTEFALQEQLENAISCSPCLVVLRHSDALTHIGTTEDGEGGQSIPQILQHCIDNANKAMEQQQCIFVGLVDEGKIPEGISFSNEIEIKALSEEERYQLLLQQVQDQGGLLASDVSIAALAKQSAALVAFDLANLVRRSHLCAMLGSNFQKLVNQPVISNKQFDAALQKARTSFVQAIGVPSIPSVLWEDVGGLGPVKDDVLDTVQLPLDHPELFQEGLKKRSGVLLYGPPGTGKTLLAKAVATSCSLNFFSVKGPELLNMYIGESEANVRKVFQRARDASPCVIFFDELDSIAPKRGNQGDSGGVMDRIVSQLLAELDGMNAGGLDIFVIGATNRPDLLDPALLRPGRFDKMLYLGTCESPGAQLDILKALTRKFNLHPDLNLSQIAAQCPFNYTGADFYALCADALLHALSSKVSELEEQRASLNILPKYQQHPISPQFFITEMKSVADLQLIVKKEDFELALTELIPSISDSELLYYAFIQKNWLSQI